MGALEFLCHIRFHHSFAFSSTDTGRSYRQSYADFGDPSSDAVVLFCGALMGTRLCYSPLDQLAKAHKVRIIHPDRPGNGGSDAVELQERIPVWLEMIPQLLSHLNISYISVASHSGGDIYALNTILTHPHLLHPTTPYIAFFAPWVHPSHSKITQLRVTELLPAPWIGKYASIARFVNDNVMPLAGLSSSFLHGIKDSIHYSTSMPAPVPLTPFTSTTLSRTNSFASRGGHPDLDLDNPDVVEELRRLITTYVFAESIDGISADAQLFLKKPHSISWCSPSLFWSDIDDFVPLLSKTIDNGGSRKWTVDAFHAESDDMVGERGRIWFDDCWRLTGATHDKSFEYRSEIVAGSEHNYLMDIAYGASERWLQRVRAAFP